MANDTAFLHSAFRSPHSALRWWGWGRLDQSYDLSQRPNFWPLLKDRLGVSSKAISPPVDLRAIALPDSRLSPQDLSDLSRIFGEDAVCVDRLSRVLHAYGKAYRDLVRIRRGDISHPPDAVVFASDEAQIAELFIRATKKGWQIIPFGGGSSVTGGVEPASQPTLTLNLTRLNRILAIDRISHTATAQCGICGPDLEAALNAEGFTLGHFPQSFEFSTLGGWLATRSAGQTSIGYGKIEAMVERVRMVTPRGIVETKLLPAAATGPDMLQLLIGSEGAFGVIVEATVRIKPLPQARDYRGVLFRAFEDGVAVIRELMQQDIAVVMARLSDANETGASLALARAPSTRRSRLRQRAGQWLIRRRGYDLASSCLLILGIEGEADRVEKTKKAALEVCKAHGGTNLGRSVGRSWRGERYALPYLRDDLLDRGIMIDTLETATTWSNLLNLHGALHCALEDAIAATGSKPFVMTHVSHAYRDGASLYSTFLGAQQTDPVAQWWSIKRAATEAILAHGGALSHHHGIGRDHAEWLAHEHGELGVQALRALKATFDPNGVLNRGVLGLEVGGDSPRSKAERGWRLNAH
ncbi:MAG TPA: FAD-binding oxidoreductase [Anaerolineae bacterium]|nr:FAD-binding oxidoreductase [Anaerolineae bacterium]